MTWKTLTFTFTLFDGDWKNQYTAALTPGDDVSIPLLDKKNKINPVNERPRAKIGSGRLAYGLDFPRIVHS
jgi:hypothetical protein